MKSFARYVYRVSPSRALFLFVLFCVFCLSSCAAGEEGAVSAPSVVDAGTHLKDVMPPEDRSADGLSLLGHADAVSSLHLATELMMDVQEPIADGTSPDRLRVAASDVVRPTMDMPPSPDVSAFETDVVPLPSPRSSPDAAATTLVDAERTDGCHEIVVRLQGTRLPMCASGWVAILYDSEGHPHESAPGGALTFLVCGRLRGVLIISARCGGEYLLDWPGSVHHPANQGGVASITLDGNELADAEALLCLDHFSPTPGIRPVIPLESFFYGRCP